MITKTTEHSREEMITKRLLVTTLRSNYTEGKSSSLTIGHIYLLAFSNDSAAASMVFVKGNGDRYREMLRTIKNFR